jgi:hypothetical protein
MTWGSGFFDTWSSPANSPGDASHWTGMQALHYTNAYNSAYGWQLAGGSTDSLWFRRFWPASGGWFKVAMYDNTHSASRGFYASIYYDNDNTTYRVDPNGTSRLLTLQVDNIIQGGVQYAQRIDGVARIAFTVGGNASTFYPVALNIGAGATAQQYGEFVIERGGYDDPGYSGIGFSTMNARFTVKASGWGFGATYENLEYYGRTFNAIANWQQVSESSRLIIWLRGATIYYLFNVAGIVATIFKVSATSFPFFPTPKSVLSTLNLPTNVALFPFLATVNRTVQSFFTP